VLVSATVRQMPANDLKLARSNPVTPSSSKMPVVRLPCGKDGEPSTPIRRKPAKTQRARSNHYR
jgi:hypothetical protein